jgi:hypothetical protein
VEVINFCNGARIRRVDYADKIIPRSLALHGNQFIIFDALNDQLHLFDASECTKLISSIKLHIEYAEDMVLDERSQQLFICGTKTIAVFE